MLSGDVSIGSDSELSGSNPIFKLFFINSKKKNVEKFWKQIFKN